MASGSAYTGARDYNGLMSGQGSLLTPSGATYEGELRDGHFHGAGALVFPNGARYRARWEAGVEVPGSGSYCWLTTSSALNFRSVSGFTSSVYRNVAG